MGIQHLQQPLSKELAKKAVQSVEEAVKAGATWPYDPRSSAPSAMTMAAAAAGVTRATFSNRLFVAWERDGLAPNGVPPVRRGKSPPRKAFKAEGSTVAPPPLPAHEREIIRLKDEVKVLKTKLEGAHREDMGHSALADIIAGLIAEPCTPPEWLFPPRTEGEESPHVPVAPFSDWHAGETVESGAIRDMNAYTIAIMEARVRRLVEKVITLARDYGPGNYPGIVVPLVGDFVSGGLHPELQKTDELRILPSILKVVDLLIWGLTTLADEFGHVFVPCCGGNHGRMTEKPEFKKYNEENADWMIYQLLARRLKDRGEKRVVVSVPPSNEAEYRIFNMRVLQVHGDMLGVKGGDGIIGAIGPIMRGKTKVTTRMRSFGADFDLLIMGHWHQELFLPGVVVSNTLKGYDEYAMKRLSAPFSLPSQPLFFVHPKYGITSYSTIVLEDPPERGASAPGWVSFPASEVA